VTNTNKNLSQGLTAPLHSDTPRCTLYRDEPRAPGGVGESGAGHDRVVGTRVVGRLLAAHKAVSFQPPLTSSSVSDVTESLPDPTALTLDCSRKQ
jgi:hypothetical protein